MQRGKLVIILLVAYGILHTATAQTSLRLHTGTGVESDLLVKDALERPFPDDAALRAISTVGNPFLLGMDLNHNIGNRSFQMGITFRWQHRSVNISNFEPPSTDLLSYGLNAGWVFGFDNTWMFTPRVGFGIDFSDPGNNNIPAINEQIPNTFKGFIIESDLTGNNFVAHFDEGYVELFIHLSLDLGYRISDHWSAHFRP